MERCASSSSEKSGPHGLLVTVLLPLLCCTSSSTLMKVILIKKKKEKEKKIPFFLVNQYKRWLALQLLFFCSLKISLQYGSNKVHAIAGIFKTHSTKSIWKLCYSKLVIHVSNCTGFFL